MSNVYKLDDLRQDIENEYTSFVIEAGDETIELRHILRIPSEDRLAVWKSMDYINRNQGRDDLSPEEQESLSSEVFNLLRHVAGDQGGTLVDRLDGDVVLAQRLVQTWMDVTSPGEAENSHDS